MSLRLIAADDFDRIVNDGRDWSWPITLINPAGGETPLQGFSQDVHMMIDPGNGDIVSGRRATVALSMRRLDPDNMPDYMADGDPWLVRFSDILGFERTFEVIESKPDRTIGNLVLVLGGWEHDNAN